MQYIYRAGVTEPNRNYGITITIVAIATIVIIVAIVTPCDTNVQNRARSSRCFVSELGFLDDRIILRL